MALSLAELTPIATLDLRIDYLRPAIGDHFVLSAQVTAAAYARNYGGTVKENRKAQRVNRAFQQVLDRPGAAAALEHPVLEPLLDEAAD